jgi:hypothetical protein
VSLLPNFRSEKVGKSTLSVWPNDRQPICHVFRAILNLTNEAFDRDRPIHLFPKPSPQFKPHNRAETHFLSSVKRFTVIVSQHLKKVGPLSSS